MDDGKGRYSALIDSAASQRTLASSKSVAELFCDGGIMVDTKVDKDVFAGICRVKEYLKRGNGKADIYIFDTCRNMIEEFLTYSWAAGDIPKKVDDHCMDELRYYIMSRPQPARREEISPVAADKARRIRKLKNSKRRCYGQK